MGHVRPTKPMNHPVQPVQNEGLDASALRQQLEHNHVAAFGWALACCRGQRSDAEDVLQNAYFKILTGKAQFAGRAEFKTWLFAVIRKTAIDAHRRVLFRRAWLLMFALRREPDEPFEPSGAGANDRQSMQELFQRALAGLPPRQREVLHLVFYQQMSVQQAADVMSVSVGSARQHYERAKRRLHVQLSASPVFHESGLARSKPRPAV